MKRNEIALPIALRLLAVCAFCCVLASIAYSDSRIYIWDAGKPDAKQQYQCYEEWDRGKTWAEMASGSNADDIQKEIAETFPSLDGRYVPLPSVPRDIPSGCSVKLIVVNINTYKFSYTPTITTQNLFTLAVPTILAPFFGTIAGVSSPEGYDTSKQQVVIGSFRSIFNRLVDDMTAFNNLVKIANAISDEQKAHPSDTNWVLREFARQQACSVYKTADYAKRLNDDIRAANQIAGDLDQLRHAVTQDLVNAVTPEQIKNVKLESNALDAIVPAVANVTSSLAAVENAVSSAVNLPVAVGTTGWARIGAKGWFSVNQVSATLSANVKPAPAPGAGQKPGGTADQSGGTNQGLAPAPAGAPAQQNSTTPDPTQLVLRTSGGLSPDFTVGTFISPNLLQPNYYIDANGRIRQGPNSNVGYAVGGMAHLYYQCSGSVALGISGGVGGTTTSVTAFVLGGSVLIGAKQRVAITYGYIWNNLSLLEGDTLGSAPIKAGSITTASRFVRGTFIGITFRL